MERPHNVALITGAGSGIGKAVAETFAKSGMQLLINDIEESGRAVAETVGGCSCLPTSRIWPKSNIWLSRPWTYTGTSIF